MDNLSKKTYFPSIYLHLSVFYHKMLQMNAMTDEKITTCVTWALQHTQTCTSTAVYRMPDMLYFSALLYCTVKSSLSTFSKYLSQSSLTEIYVSNEQAKSDSVLSSKQAN